MAMDPKQERVRERVTHEPTIDPAISDDSLSSRQGWARWQASGHTDGQLEFAPTVD